MAKDQLQMVMCKDTNWENRLKITWDSKLFDNYSNIEDYCMGSKDGRKREKKEKKKKSQNFTDKYIKRWLSKPAL